MSFKIIFFILPLVLTSCSQLSKKECQKSRVEESAFKHGAEGASNRLHRIKKKCKKDSNLETIYNSAYKEGLIRFCSKNRGEEQASLGLEKEVACLISPAYKTGHLSKLDSICTVQKARIDARKLLNSDNRICLQISKYKKSYLYHLKKHCSYSKGYSIGLEQKEIDQNCKDSKNLKQFQQGHKAGLSKSYKNDNIKLQKVISKLKTQRKSLKAKKINLQDPKSVRQHKIELNVLESKLLDAEHQIEKNTRFIN